MTNTSGGFQAKRAAAADKQQDVRGFLASKLKCWHRLTGEESDELVAVFEGQVGQLQPLTEMDITEIALSCIENKGIHFVIGIARGVEAHHGIKAPAVQHTFPDDSEGGTHD